MPDCKKHQNVAVLIAMETELAIHQYLVPVGCRMAIKRGIGKCDLDLEEEEVAELIQLTKTAIYHREGDKQPKSAYQFYWQYNVKQDFRIMGFFWGFIYCF